ncbi:FeoB-associated Cys-rich membrane protein [Pseudodesulfovibrio profundus]|uniref:FeoB-associated Cys-rich membrane protein n=1 Tax=Pseudodesulfovibrio profundus TaxID=57320 RepID=UPI000BE27757|nr:FeoB-associated Cys-rich membrane protein [Pseudodesulfovibrio profundus]
MDTIIAILIIIVAAFFVFNKVRKQLQAKDGCGCGGDCGAPSKKNVSPCCDNEGENCSCDK